MRAFNYLNLSILLILTLTSCASLPESGPYESRIIETGYGPEDMVIDSTTSAPTLLISCSSRRKEYPEYGEIERFYLGNSSGKVMERIGDPADLVLKPHGISICKEKDGLYHLYVISHNNKKDQHPIIKYIVEENRLIFEKIFKDDLLVSPNAIHAFSDGSFLVCNDAGKRNSMIEKIFRLKHSNIIYFNEKGKGLILADRMGMVAGLFCINDHVYASASLENKIYLFDFKNGKLENKQQFVKIKGPDNIRLHENELIITSHSKPFKFIRHVNNRDKKSPSLIYTIEISNRKMKVIYSNPGELIPAASTAVILDNYLYISQIFEPWIVEISLK